MREKILVWILLLISQFTFSQIKGVVKDSLTGNPVPYVNIWVEGENFGATSIEDGTFSINTSEKSKNLIFSTIGFETKKYSVFNANNVVLKPIVYQLDDVVLTKFKNSKQIEIGDSKKRFYLPEPQNTPWIFARKINFDVTNSDARFLKTLIYYTKSELDSAKFRVRLFSVSKNDMPEEDLLSKEIIVQVKKGKHKIEVDLLTYKIEVPKQGIIVGFESLFVEENKYIEKISIPKSNNIVKNDNYDPHIFYQYIDSESSYTFRTGKWVKQQMNMNQQWQEDKKVIAPVIKAVLTN
ncbi:carboxypeptidase-like regulatory domain-containing protein [Flavobacterium chungnamense]|jgi:hypothetical protein|uniref:Carboxypeptidase-like regulatory domain-containing protein n=1 Tax=Flavobacterium chungnamense TaxID=706182 RepID=A0ABP7USE5_9FLAO